MRKYSLLFFCLLASFFFTGPVAAETDSLYISPSSVSLAKTLVKIRGTGLTQKKMLDEFALITECEIYQKYHHDEFQWKDVRQALLETILYEQENYPTKYKITGRIDLGDYDFDKNAFRLREEDMFVNMGLVSFQDSLNFKTDIKEACKNKSVMTYFPVRYEAVLRNPLTFTEIPMTPEEAQHLLKRMSYNGNKQRALNVELYLSVIRVNTFQENKLSFIVNLDTVKFFENSGLLLYIHVPENYP